MKNRLTFWYLHLQATRGVLFSLKCCFSKDRLALCGAAEQLLCDKAEVFLAGEGKKVYGGSELGECFQMD